MNKSGLIIFYLLVSFLVVSMFLFQGASRLIVFFKTGADRANMLLLSSENMNDYYQPKITWYNIGKNKGREMTKGTRQKVTKDYLASYYYQYEAFKTGNPKALHDHFTEHSREHLTHLVNHYQSMGQIMQNTSIEHRAEIEFFSADGSIVTLRDQVISHQQLTQEEGLSTRSYDTSDYRVMLLLEDNFWRVRHKIRESPILTKAQKVALDSSRPYVSNNVLFVGQQPFIMKGINYYPQEYPWQEMWNQFDSIDFEADLKLIKSLSFNTLRIFVPYEFFGGASTSPEELSKLIKFLNLAEQNQLKVIVTLFDFFLGYNIQEWTLSDRHVEQVIAIIGNHPALLAWDVKNEPDLDFESIGQDEVLEWLKFITRRIKGYDPNGLVTIGWSQPEYLDLLANEIDFLSFHFYREPSDLNQFLSSYRSIGKPIFLGETGKHSFSKWWYPFKSTPEEQLSYYQEILTIAQAYNINYCIWTLYDFDHVPSNVAGRWPWQKGPQKSYGLIDTDNNHKSSLDFFKQLNLNYKYERQL